MVAQGRGRYRLWAAGSNSGYQLGIGHDDDAHSLVPAQAASPSSSSNGAAAAQPFPPLGWRIESLSSGANHTVAILAPDADANDLRAGGNPVEKQVWIVGTGAQGQLGDVETRSTQALVAFRHLDLQAEVFGPLVKAGKLSEEDATSYTPKAVACGWNVTYLVLAARSPADKDQRHQAGDLIVSLGLAKDNAFGELGTPDTDVGSSVHIVNAAAALGDGSQRGWVVYKIAAGLRHAAVLLSPITDDDAPKLMYLIGWGSARHGQVGQAPKMSDGGSKRPRPGPAPAIVWTPQLVHTWQLSGGDHVDATLALAAGRDHTVALVRGELAFFGSNRQGQCGVSLDSSLPVSTVAAVACNWNGTSVLLKSDRATSSTTATTTVVSAGNNQKGQFGSPPSTAPRQDGSFVYAADLSPIYECSNAGESVDIIALASGSEHTLLLVRRGSTTEVWGTGWNEHGNLAQGDEEDRHHLVRLSLPSLAEDEQPTAIWAGCGTTFIQTSTVPPPSSRFTLQLPKIELHAHLNGSIRRQTLRELAQEVDEDAQTAFILERETRSLSDAFAVFEVIHSCVRRYEHVERIAEEMCEDMERDGVVYAEVRTTPRAMEVSTGDVDRQGVSGEERYVLAVLDGFERYATKARKRQEGKEGRTKTHVRLLLSIDRKGDPAQADRTVTLALRHRERGIVGIDLSGNPTRGEWADWAPALLRARDEGLKIALHAGEVRNRNDEMAAMLDFAPDRFGHCCFLSPTNATRMRASGVPLELCLTSNVLSASVDSYESHHFGLHYRAPTSKKGDVAVSSSSCENEEDDDEGRNPVILCTDDSAVFGSALSNEYAIAMRAFAMDERETFQLAREAVDAVFLASERDADVLADVVAAFDAFEAAWFGSSS